MAKKKTVAKETETMIWPYPIYVHGNQQKMVFGRPATPLDKKEDVHTVEVPDACVENELGRSGRRLLSIDEYEDFLAGDGVEEDDPDYPNPNKDADDK